MWLPACTSARELRGPIDDDGDGDHHHLLDCGRREDERQAGPVESGERVGERVFGFSPSFSFPSDTSGFQPVSVYIARLGGG